MFFTKTHIELHDTYSVGQTVYSLIHLPHCNRNVSTVAVDGWAVVFGTSRIR